MLGDFNARWGDRRATIWTDSVTGLSVGEVAKSYLTASTDSEAGDLVSIVVLHVDRLDAYRSGQGEDVSRSILARVAVTVRAAAATVGAVSQAHRDGLIVLVLPEFSATRAAELAESLRGAVAKLAFASSEPISADSVTASIVAITGRVRRGIDRAHLLARAISRVKDVAATGGNRVVGLTASDSTYELVLR